MKKPSVHLVGCLFVLALGSASLSSCQSDGFASSLTLTGAETQRDLASDVHSTLGAQEACQREFSEAFELLTGLQQSEVDDVADLYHDLQGKVDTCAEHVRRSGARIGGLRESGAVLFTDWASELDEFVSPGMRSRSEDRMHDARRGLDDLLAGLERAQVQMEEILMLQRDYVLFFNHNLSAHSIESLAGENEHFQDRMSALADEFADVSRSADKFVVELHGAPTVHADS